MVARSIPRELRRLDIDLETLGRYGPIIGLVGLYVVFTALNPRFLTIGNQVNVLRQVSIIGILAVGVTFPIICAEIDLSIAEMMEFTGLFVAALATGSVIVSTAYPIPVAIAGGLLAGVVLGGVSGVVTSRYGVPSFMSTLAMLFLAQGFALIVSDARPITGLPDSLQWFGGETIYRHYIVQLDGTFQVPAIVLVFLGLLVLSQFVLSYTRFGLYVYAVGGDRDAAQRMGINVALVRLLVIVISAVFAAVAGIVMLGRIGIGSPTMGQGLLLPPIAAVILGGANLFGGSGNMVGTLVGVLILGVLQNGLNLLGVDPAGQSVAQGIVLMLAVLANVVARE
jgi:ribose/xylose/arabinose/galactoside ABC-type transport system permease subunit